MLTCIVCSRVTSTSVCKNLLKDFFIAFILCVGVEVRGHLVEVNSLLGGL